MASASGQGTFQSTSDGSSALLFRDAHSTGSTQDAASGALPTGPSRMDDFNPGPRWGHTAAYLPSAKSIIFIGGQVPSNSSEKAGMVTNDVFALDVSQLVAANVSAAQQGSRSGDKGDEHWTLLNSANLPPHAFAARALTHKANQENGQIWLVGGATDDCTGNAPVYRWSTSTSNLTDGKWDALHDLPNNLNVSTPVRRRGARAVQVPNELGLQNMQDEKKARQTGAITFMVVGGTTDGSTCAPVASSSRGTADYFGVDFWSALPSASAKGGAISTRSLALDNRMSGFPVVDYATVLLPANSVTKSNARVLFLGGRDSHQSLVDMNHVWALDLATGKWERWITTASVDAQDMPAGRLGHTASRTSDGKIIMHGGFLSTAASGVHRNATDEVFVLDPTVTPARWSRVSGMSGKMPPRAFHTAIWADKVLVIGFGQESEGTSAVDQALSTRAQSNTQTRASSGLLYYLDTAAPGGWRWSSSIAEVLSNRQSFATDPDTSPQSEAQQTSNGEASKGAILGDHQTGAGAAKDHLMPQSNPLPNVGTQHIISGLGNGENSAHADTAPNVIAPSSPSSSLSQPGKSGVIAGSVLGAAALVAAFAGVYAARTRKRRRLEEKDALQSYYARDVVSPVDTLADRGPPVSSLWINQPKTWANSASRGLKRHASNASNAIFNRGRRDDQTDRDVDEEKSTYTSHMQGPGAVGAFKIKRKAPPRVRSSMRRQQEAVRAVLGDPPHASSFEASRAGLPEAFIEALGADLDDAGAPASVQRTIRGGRRAHHDLRDSRGAEGEELREYLDVPDMGQPLERMMTRAPSSESLGSVGTASHFSYPYLAAMHRPSMATMCSPGQATLDLGSSPARTRTSPALRTLELPNAMRQHRIRRHQAPYAAAALREYGSKCPPTPVRVSSRQETPAWWKEMMTSPERKGMLWSPTLLSPKTSLRRGNREPSDEGTEEMLVNAAEMDGATSPTITDFAMDVAAQEDGRRRRSMSSPLFPWEENVNVGGTTLRASSPVPFHHLPTRPASALMKTELVGTKQPLSAIGPNAEVEATLDAQRRRSQHASRRKARKSTLRVMNAVVRPSSSEECAERTPTLH
ncbi:hypothetical protein CBOM_06686 [Ceraceosorus bombacis]|uniref:Galactose oxidase n=1 Tax=Ceraceosorus bombacis TaxID=401625 RepID=A0A0P1BSH9_9BASI|nr:hypothetical protein CBOM_06686 [Ceraceosorus bombacis]